MKKLKAVAAVLIFIGCQTKKQTSTSIPQPKYNVVLLDTVRKPSSIDTALKMWSEAMHYKNLSDSCHIKGLEYEALYYRTGQDSYRIKGNKAYAGKVKYAKLGVAAWNNFQSSRPK